MKIIRDAVLQAMAVLAIAIVVGFAFNAASRNGINPFRNPGAVPVASDSMRAGAEGIRVITLAAARLAVDGGVQVVDARRKEDYEAGHIPGALLFDYYNMGMYRDHVLPLLANDREIMVYCSEISCEDSELLAKELYSLGFKRLLLFKGGFVEWSSAGLPIEGGAQ